MFLMVFIVRDRYVMFHWMILLCCVSIINLENVWRLCGVFRDFVFMWFCDREKNSRNVFKHINIKCLDLNFFCER